MVIIWDGMKKIINQSKRSKILQTSKMGGPRKCTEVPNCVALKKNIDLWVMFRSVINHPKLLLK